MGARQRCLGHRALHHSKDMRGVVHCLTPPILSKNSNLLFRFVAGLGSRRGSLLDIVPRLLPRALKMGRCILSCGLRSLFDLASTVSSRCERFGLAESFRSLAAYPPHHLALTCLFGDHLRRLARIRQGLLDSLLGLQ